MMEILKAEIERKRKLLLDKNLVVSVKCHNFFDYCTYRVS